MDQTFSEKDHTAASSLRAGQTLQTLLAPPLSVPTCASGRTLKQEQNIELFIADSEQDVNASSDLLLEYLPCSMTALPAVSLSSLCSSSIEA